MNFGPPLNCFALIHDVYGPNDVDALWLQAIKFGRRRSTNLACLITWFFVYEVQNIQLNVGSPQEFDAWDIFCIIKLGKKVSLELHFT